MEAASSWRDRCDRRGNGPVGHPDLLDSALRGAGGPSELSQGEKQVARTSGRRQKKTGRGLGESHLYRM